MKVKLSPLVQQKLLRLNNKDKKLILRIQKQIELFESNPTHPSLRTHKLTGNLSNRWSISINRSLRMVYVTIQKDVAYFIDVGTHDEVYKK